MSKKSHAVLPTSMLHCVYCHEWVSEETLPHSDYVCASCAAQGRGVARRRRQLQRDIAALEAALRACAVGMQDALAITDEPDAPAGAKDTEA
jgi:hypothetical protein